MNKPYRASWQTNPTLPSKKEFIVTAVIENDRTGDDSGVVATAIVKALTAKAAIGRFKRHIVEAEWTDAANLGQLTFEANEHFERLEA